MDRINGAGTIDIGGGRRGFRDENLGAGVEGTEVKALWLNMTQEEIIKVIESAGLSLDPGNWTQLYQAIGILLDALFADVEAAYPFATTPEAIAGLLTSKIISPKTLADVLAGLLSAPTKLSLVNSPVFPEILTANNKLAVSTAGLSVSVDAGQAWMVRGAFRYSSNDYAAPARTFAVVNGKTYHLRWSVAGGFVMRDLADAAYNPGALAETDTSFDSTYDDMLVARVVAAGGVATVTTLVNAARLFAMASQSGTGTVVTTGSGSDGIRFTATFTLNWARKPTSDFNGHTGNNGAVYLHGYANQIVITGAHRYSVTAQISSDYKDPIDAVGNCNLNFSAAA